MSELLFTRVDRCWVCGGTEFTTANQERLDFGNAASAADLWAVLGDYHGQSFTLNQCRTCRFMQPAALPAHPAYFETIYDLRWSSEWMENEFASGYKDLIFGTILKELGRRVAPGQRRLLDVGAHVGRMLHLARAAGWRPEGLELNPRTARFAAERTGLPVHRMNARDAATTGARFDAVVLTDVLEHIPDPVAILSDLRALLNPGGWVAVKVPYGVNQLLKQRIRLRLSQRHDPGIAMNYCHVNHFGPRSLARALATAGFDAIQVGVGAPELPPGNGLKGLSSRGFRCSVYTAARWLPFGAHTPLALNLQAYARKPAD
jgi:SAM-dependent methyltransferase